MERNILVIEGSEEKRYEMTYLLENSGKGYKVFTGEDGDEGFQILNKNSNIQVVVLDIIWLGNNAIQRLRELMDKFENIKIIVLTGVSSKFSSDEAKEVGVFRYLSKPLAEEPLIFALEDAFKYLIAVDMREKRYSAFEENEGKIVINDRWVINQLNKNIDFSNFKIGEVKPLSMEAIYDVYNFEDDEFSIWFSQRTFDEIFEKRIFPILEIGGLKYVKDLLKGFLKFERLTYLTPFFSEFKRSRDHFLHQFRIAILGDFLLNCYIGDPKDKRKLIDPIKKIFDAQDRHNKNHTVAQVRTTWWVTALLHDCSYPLYHIFFPNLFQKSPYVDLNKIYSDVFLEEFKSSFESALKNFTDDFKEKLKDLITELELENFGKHILNSFENDFSHNITSAFNLWEKFKGSRNHAFLPKVAAESIILHHNFQNIENSDKEKRIGFVEYPLAFLLIVLDEVQEWGRPIVVEDDINPTKISKLIELDKVIIQGIHRDEAGNHYINKDKLSFILDYKDRGMILEKTKLDPGRKLEEKKHNLSRLLITVGDLPKIEIQVRFPTFDASPILIE